MSKWTTEQRRAMEQVEGKLTSARAYGQQTPKGREHEIAGLSGVEKR